MGSIGETLRQARIDKGVSLVDAERSTHIRRRYLDALESDDFGALPALVYTRGFIRTYAEYLGLSPQAMVDQFQPARSREPAPRLRATTPGAPRQRRIPARWIAVVGGAALLLILLLYLRGQYNGFQESLVRAQVTQLPSRVNQPTATVESSPLTPVIAAAPSPIAS